MFFGVGLFRDFVGRPGTTPAEGPHVGPQHVRREPNEIELTIRVLTDHLTAPFCHISKILLSYFFFVILFRAPAGGVWPRPSAP